MPVANAGVALGPSGGHPHALGGRGQAGFTLLELLVALAVFAVMAVAAYSGLRSVLTTQTAVEKEAQRLAQVQMAFSFLERDMQQAIDRRVRDEYGQEQPAFLGGAVSGELVMLTRVGWDNPLGRGRATLERLAYRLDASRLVRSHWDTLDRGGAGEPREVTVLDHVTGARVRFLDEAGDWHSEWPPEGIGAATGASADIATGTPAGDATGTPAGDATGVSPGVPAGDSPGDLPRAVEFSLELDDWGEITREFLTPEH